MGCAFNALAADVPGDVREEAPVVPFGCVAEVLVVGVVVGRVEPCGIVGNDSRSDAPKEELGLNGLIALPPRPVA